MDKSAGFRAPDQEFCDAFNAGLDATGWTINDLAVAAMRAGLVPAVAMGMEQRREAENHFQKKHSLKDRNLPKGGKK